MFLALIEPIPEYTRHTLKAFNVFINNDFEGYFYDRGNSDYGTNPKTEATLGVQELLEKSFGYVGVQYGLSGLITMERNKLQKHKFQFTTVNMTRQKNWIDVGTFRKLAHWILEGAVPDVTWDAALPVRSIYKITKECVKAKVYIGFKGGLAALNDMPNEVIAGKKWSIRTIESPPTNQWIEGNIFREVIERKNVF